jgi:hypothetical protein
MNPRSNLMTTLTIDTLRYTNRLKAAGVPQAQAEAEAEALAEAVATFDTATKADIRETENVLRREIEVTRREIAEAKLDLIKWIVGLALAQFGLLVGILMRGLH